MHQIEVSINRAKAIRHVERATWKQGRMLEQPQSVRQVYNVQADENETTDQALMRDSFDRWAWACVDIVREFLRDVPHYPEKPDQEHDPNDFIIPLRMPENWVVKEQDGLQREMVELVYNGMMADWYDDMKPDQAVIYKKRAEANKAEIHSTIYALNAPE